MTHAPRESGCSTEAGGTGSDAVQARDSAEILSIDVELPQEHRAAIEALPGDLVPRLFAMLDEQHRDRENRRVKDLERFGC